MLHSNMEKSESKMATATWLSLIVKLTKKRNSARQQCNKKKSEPHPRQEKRSPL
jgi:hypothetical protein